MLTFGSDISNVRLKEMVLAFIHMTVRCAL